jgi:hypothetical protein
VCKRNNRSHIFYKITQEQVKDALQLGTSMFQTSKKMALYLDCVSRAISDQMRAIRHYNRVDLFFSDILFRFKLPRV